MRIIIILLAAIIVFLFLPVPAKAANQNTALTHETFDAVSAATNCAGTFAGGWACGVSGTQNWRGNATVGGHIMFAGATLTSSTLQNTDKIQVNYTINVG